MIARRHRIVIVAIALALGLAGCGNKATPQRVADANNDGAYVNAGPMTYQLQISRELNAYSVEDSQYLRGLPLGTPTNLGQSEFWYGVFLWAKNQTDRPQTTSDNFEIVDAEGNLYTPVKLNAALNPFAWTAQTVRPGQTQPVPGSAASNGPTQGGLLLFRLATSAYSNRPLSLFILGPGGKRLAAISLDL